MKPLAIAAATAALLLPLPSSATSEGCDTLLRYAVGIQEGYAKGYPQYRADEAVANSEILTSDSKSMLLDINEWIYSGKSPNAVYKACRSAQSKGTPL